VGRTELEKLDEAYNRGDEGTTRENIGQSSFSPFKFPRLQSNSRVEGGDRRDGGSFKKFKLPPTSNKNQTNRLSIVSANNPSRPINLTRASLRSKGNASIDMSQCIINDAVEDPDFLDQLLGGLVPPNEFIADPMRKVHDENSGDVIEEAKPPNSKRYSIASKKDLVFSRNSIVNK
jgi:hypothetical protein